MEELDPREISGLRSIIDTCVERFLGVDDLYATVPLATSKEVEKPELEVILIE